MGFNNLKWDWKTFDFDRDVARGDLPVTEAWAAECLSLPLYPELTDTQQDRVIEVVRGFFGDPRIGMTPKGMHSSFHFGIDIACPNGTAVYATLDGVVTPAFPDGLTETLDHVRSAGMIPGIWFEFETVGSRATSFTLTDHLLKRDGVPVTVGDRRFWDFRDPFVIGYLKERMIDFLKANGFGYLKVDYNNSIGIGCDAAESQGPVMFAICPDWTVFGAGRPWSMGQARVP